MNIEKMKKPIFVILAVLVCIVAVSCGNEPAHENENVITAEATPNETTITVPESEDETAEAPMEIPSEEVIGNSLSDMVKDIYNGVEVPMTFETVINEENALYYLGITDTSVFTEAISSDAMINVIPHSVCLVKVADGQDVEAVKAVIEENANPNKWICAQADTVIVDNVGDVIILIMVNDPVASAIHENFLGLE
jgi:hypothetical protein